MSTHRIHKDNGKINFKITVVEGENVISSKYYPCKDVRLLMYGIKIMMKN